MCGRYEFSAKGVPELEQILRNAQRRDPAGACAPAGEMTPGARVPVLVARGDKVVAEYQQWGIPGWRGKAVINARAETVCEKPMFRRSMAACRCAVPANGYYEWDAARHKYYFYRSGQPLYLAGVYDPAGGMDRFVILTTRPNSSVREIHDRMPLVLTHAQVRPWLTDAAAALALLAAEPPALERRCEDGQLRLDDVPGP